MSYCDKHRHLAQRDAMAGRCLECENAALRKRVEELWFDLCEYQKHEQQLCPDGEGFVSYVPKLRKRVEELEREARFFENESDQWNAKWVEMEARAKKAERERRERG